MKKLYFILAVLVLIFAGCSIINPPLVDHSDTVKHYADFVIYDFDQSGFSGFYFKADGTGEVISVSGNADLIDFWFNDRDYTAPTYMSPDGDTTVYVYPDTVDANTTYFYTITDAEPESVMTAPDDFDDIISATVENDGWYFLLIEDGRYVKMHVTNMDTDNNWAEFEYWIQQDTTQFFGLEE